MRWGGGGTPSIDEPDEKKGKSNPQSVVDTVIPDEEKINWNDVVAEYISDQQVIDPNFSYPIQGSGSKSNPYLISSAMDLAYISYSSRNGVTYLFDYFEFTDDIYLNDGYFEADGTYHDGGDGKLYEWCPIIQEWGSSFFGNDHTIYGLYFNNLDAEAGLFTASGGFDLIENLKQSKMYVKCSKFQGAFAYNSKVIRNCYVKDGYIYSSKSATYVFAYSVDEAVNCHNYAEANGTTTTMFGYSKKAVSNCSNHGQFTVRNVPGQGCGAITMYLSGNLIENCYNYGNVIGQRYTSGIVGAVLSTSTKIRNCENHGNIAGSNSGGIFAQLDAGKKVEIINCKNTGLVSGSSSGAIVGTMITWGTITTKLTILDCYAERFVPVIGWMYIQPSSNVEICMKSCVFDCANAVSSTGDILFAFTNYYSGYAKFEIQDVQINLGRKTNFYLFRGNAYDVDIRNLLVNVERDYTNLWNSAPIVNARSIIIQKNQRPYAFYGNNFLGFFFSWKTCEVGVINLVSLGAFQGIVEEDWLIKRGAEKRG